MLAWYMLRPCVSLSVRVRPSARLFITSRYCIETTGRIELDFGMEASFHLPHTVL